MRRSSEACHLQTSLYQVTALLCCQFLAPGMAPDASADHACPDLQPARRLCSGALIPRAPGVAQGSRASSMPHARALPVTRLFNRIEVTSEMACLQELPPAWPAADDAYGPRTGAVGYGRTPVQVCFDAGELDIPTCPLSRRFPCDGRPLILLAPRHAVPLAIVPSRSVRHNSPPCAHLACAAATCRHPPTMLRWA
jgi:hypothetical protein